MMSKEGKKIIKMEEETYKVLRGMKTLKKQHRKEGESKWYYLDPRGARTIADMGEIDVESEHAPNPYAREILIDDMRRHEEDYNCRCWAEPFEFKKMKRLDIIYKKMVITG